MKHMFDCDRMESGKKRFMKKADLIFLFAILFAALIFLLFFDLGAKQGSYAQVSCDGTVVCRISLSQQDTQYYMLTGQPPVKLSQTKESQEKPAMYLQELSPDRWMQEADRIISADENVNYNVFMYQNGETKMLQSNCPDLICVHHNAIRRTGENIICLPHKVVIEIIGGSEQELDGVIY